MAIKNVTQDKTSYNDPLEIDWMMDSKLDTYIRVSFCNVYITNKFKEEPCMSAFLGKAQTCLKVDLIYQKIF